MREFDAGKADELAHAYRVLRAAPLRARGASRGCSTCSSARRRGPHASGSSARSGTTSSSSRSRPSASAGSWTSSSAPTRRRAASRSRPDPRRARAARRRPDDTAYVGDAPFDIAAAKNAGVHAIGVTWGGIHTPSGWSPKGPTRSWTPPTSSMPSSDEKRAAELASCSTATSTSTTSSTTRRSPTPSTTGSTTSLSRWRRRARARRARLADASSWCAALGPLPEGAAPRADGLAREGDDRRGAREVGRRRPQASRHRRAGCLRDRAEDRRARGQPHLRERRARARGDAWGRRSRART